MRALDSSIIISALCAGDPAHQACRDLLIQGNHVVFTHALTETFSTLTGGRLGFRLSGSVAATLLREHVSPRLTTVTLEPEDLFTAFSEAESRGIRGGAIYDYLHLFAARKAGAEKIHTLNLSDFLSFRRPGDPNIASV
jgi:predicted nucleic acid-binding protein